MRRSVLPMLLLLLVSPPGMPRAAAAQLNYTLYVLGLPVADAVVTINQTATSYRITLHYQHTGVVGLVASNRLDMHARGDFEKDQPAALEFGAVSRFRGQDRTVGVAWHDGTPVVTALSPPVETEREPVPPPLRAHTIDPLSSIILLLRKVAQTGHCEGAPRVYDGRRLRLFEARTLGEEIIPPSIRSSFSGRGLACGFTEHTIAGFRLGETREEDAKPRGGTIWLAQVLPGSAPLPVRAAVETRWLGEAVIYLTAAFP